MMKIILVFLFMVPEPPALALFGSNEIHKNEASEFDRLMLENKYEEFSAFVDGKTVHGFWGRIENNYGFQALGMATSPKNWASLNNAKLLEKEVPFCRTKFVARLIELGAIPTNETKLTSKGDLPTTYEINIGHLSGAIESLCESTVLLLLEKMKGDQIAEAGLNYQMIHFDKYAYDEKLAPIVANILKALATANKKKCSGENQNCKAVAHLKGELDQFRERELARRHENTKEGKAEALAREICDSINEANRYKKMSKEEKEKGKISGYVNVVKLKTWGDKIYEFQKASETEQSNYKSLTGKQFDLKRCQ